MDWQAGLARGIVVLGCGKMGSALLAGWLAQGMAPETISVIEPNPSDWLRGTGVRLNAGLPADPGVVLVAVKPQMMAAALPGLADLGGGRTLFVSVAAGVSLESYARILGPQTPVVRAMPNTPAAVGQGISAIVANGPAGIDGLALAEALLSAVGTVVRLEDESQMDAVTGLSGSGPAYVFHLVEALAAAGIAEGLAPDLAMTLARATVAGAGALLAASEESAEQLRRNVTSPQGTTHAGLEVLMPALPDLMTRTVAAAARRSRELAG